MHLHESLLITSFKRLAEVMPSDKRGMERTSSLMFFLAFDELAHSHGANAILFDPDSSTSLANRDEFAKRYSNLVRIGWGSGGQEWFVTNLGDVNTNSGRTAEKKFSCDFLTVPLKKASIATQPQPYPKRPSPLLLLGIDLCNKKWGISRHLEWKRNLPVFLSDRSSPTPWTDLAIFIFRDTHFPAAADLRQELKAAIRPRFSPELTAFWLDQITAEMKRSPHKEPFFQEMCSYALRDFSAQDSADGDAVVQQKKDLDDARREINRLQMENLVLRNKLGISST